MKIKLWKLTVLALVLIAGIAVAIESPVSMLQRISNRMISSLENSKSRLRRPQVIHNIVNRVLIPHIALNRMGASVVGPRYWRAASSSQRSQFIRQFSRLVISTYSAALASYDDDRVRFYPLRGGYTGRTVQVRSVIIRRTGQRIPLSYNLVRMGNSWKIYDFSVENVSIVQSYRAQFANVLAVSGMRGLIQRLIRHNRRR